MEVKCHSQHMTQRLYQLPSWLNTVDVDLHRLVEVVFIRCLHWKVPSFFQVWNFFLKLHPFVCHADPGMFIWGSYCPVW